MRGKVKFQWLYLNVLISADKHLSCQCSVLVIVGLRQSLSYLFFKLTSLNQVSAMEIQRPLIQEKPAKIGAGFIFPFYFWGVRGCIYVITVSGLCVRPAC